MQIRSLHTQSVRCCPDSVLYSELVLVMYQIEGSSIAWGPLLPSAGPPLPLPRVICVGRPVRAAGCTRLTTGSACIPTEAPSTPLVAFTLGTTTSPYITSYSPIHRMQDSTFLSLDEGPWHTLKLLGCCVRQQEKCCFQRCLTGVIGDQAFLEEVMEEGWVLDGTIAQDSTQTAAIWGLREGISVALKHAGATPPCCATHCCTAHSEESPCQPSLTHPTKVADAVGSRSETLA